MTSYWQSNESWDRARDNYSGTINSAVDKMIQFCLLLEIQNERGKSDSVSYLAILEHPEKTLFIVSPAHLFSCRVLQIYIYIHGYVLDLWNHGMMILFYFRVLFCYEI